jgi:prephenate dehydrogenase
MEAIGATASSFEALIADANNVVILAGPPRAVLSQIETIATPALVIDVAGVKLDAVQRAAGKRFVGTHPMAGREMRGPAGATPSLFRGATWVVTTDGAQEEDLEYVEANVGGAGSPTAPDDRGRA